MNNFNQNFQNPIYHLINRALPKFCDKCGHQYNSNNIEVSFPENNKALCKIHCEACSNTYMVHLVAQEDGLISMAKANTLSNLSLDELEKFSTFEEIEPNEIIDVHSALKNVKTIDDFKKLLKSV